MYTVDEIKRNPTILMLYEDELSLELKIEAIKTKPSLLNSIEDKSLVLRQIAFEAGFWNDEIATLLDSMTVENLEGFVASAEEMYIEKFLELRKDILPETVAAKLITRNSKYYQSHLIEKSDSLDLIILENITYLDAETENPLAYIGNLTQPVVQKMYDKFGKFALMGIHSDFQTKEMKLDIIEKSVYDYSYICFDEEIAQLYVTDYISSLPYVMQRSKYDPFYDVRVLTILSIYGNALEFVENQTEEMQILAVKNCPMAIQFAKKPTDNVCLIALNADKDCADFIEHKSKEVCKFLGIKYVKPSKYSVKNKYLVTLSSQGMNCYRVLGGDKIDAFLNTECEHDDIKAKKIAKVKEISDDEIKVLKKFGLLKTINPFFSEMDDEDFDEED